MEGRRRKGEKRGGGRRSGEGGGEEDEKRRKDAFTACTGSEWEVVSGLRQGLPSSQDGVFGAETMDSSILQIESYDSTTFSSLHEEI